jgi:NTP pyrophosphatase (non-canonical NTP hydrolase)
VYNVTRRFGGSGMSISIEYLQEYIRSNDYKPELKEKYFMKLAEEVGELSRTMRKNQRPLSENEIKGNIDEELWDVIYFAIAIANCYDIDLAKVIPIKEQYNNRKYGGKSPFEVRRTSDG